MKKNIYLYILFSFLVLVFLGCNNTSKTNNDINIYAAASLQESLEEIVTNYNKENNEEIYTSLGGSNKLRMQIEEGAKADIFISANKDQYDKLKESGFLESGETILHNSLVIITPKENKANITSLEDIINKKCKIILADKEVPVGKYSIKALDNLSTKYGDKFKNDFLNKVVSYEGDVKKVLTKIKLNEGDVGIVYKSDLNGGENELNVIEIPSNYNVKAEYWIGKIKNCQNEKGRDKIYNYIVENKDIFKKYGYDIAN